MLRRISTVVMLVLLVLMTINVQAQEMMECFGSEGSSVSILASWTGEEEETFKAVLAPVLEACDLTLNYEGSRDMNTILPTRVEGGAPPDIAALANPGAIKTFSENLVPLEEVSINADNYVQGWKDAGSVDGTWLGLPIKSDIKSIVWYSPIAFEVAGYEVPTTWEDFVALLAQMAEDGEAPPLSMGFESGGATGWTATDFIQDILVRTQGADYTNGLATGETAWDDEGVVEAWQMYVDWVNNYAAGGADGALTTAFGDAILLPFKDPPEAWMVKQSGFAGSAFVQPNFPDYVYGEDFAFFPLPGPEGEAVPMQVGADFMGVFNNTPAVQALVAYLSSAEGAAAWAASGFDLTPNSAADLAAYTNEISADKAAVLVGAAGYCTPEGGGICDLCLKHPELPVCQVIYPGEVSFDIGDLLPPGVGQAEFDGITAVVGGADVAETLAGIQELMTEAMEGS